MDTLDKDKLIEKEIQDQQRNISYDTKEYTVEIIVKKYQEGLEKDDNEFFVPDYQREFVWDDVRQSRFIESLLMGLPIPYIFLAETKEGRYEMVDGSQRIRTLAAFVSDELKLRGLDKIKEINGIRFSQLPKSRQRKFLNISLKMIVLSELTTEESKNDIFERINRGSDILKEMEKRKGIYKGAFNDYIYSLAKNELYQKLTPISHWVEKRQEREELLLRFFAFSEIYPNFKDNVGIAKQLDYYMEGKNKSWSKEEESLKTEEFNKTIQFVNDHFQYGFAKGTKHQISRMYFEAISIGVLFALREKPDVHITEKQIKEIVESDEFKKIINTRSHTHKRDRIISRIDYIRDKLISYE